MIISIELIVKTNKGDLMNTRQLETFLCASRTLNLTEAAIRLNYAQSSITAHIKRLEEELGYDLFERVGRRVILTSQGELFRDIAEKLLMLMNEAKLVGEKKQLVIGAPESQCFYRIPSILAKYKQLYPEIKMLFRPDDSNRSVEQKIADGDFDVGFITEFKLDACAKLTYHELASEKIMLLCSPDHELSNKKSVMLDDLKNENFLLPENECSFHTMLEKILQKQNIYLSNITEFISVGPLIQCAKLNTGLTVLPELTVQNELTNGELVPIHLDVEFPMASTYLAYHKDKKLPNHLKCFIEVAMEFAI